MALTLSALFVFLTVFFALVGGYSIVADLWLLDRARLGERLDEEFLRQQRERARHSSLFRDLGRVAAELAAEEPRRGWRVRTEEALEQAGLDLTPERLLLIAAGLGVLLAAGGFLGRGLGWALAGGLVGVVLPPWYVMRRRRRRLGALLAQLPDAFEMMARVLQAGQTLPQALQAVVRDFRPPLAGEFALCYEQQNLGLSPEAAYEDLGRRTGLLELKILALATAVQQQSGGNFAEVLDRLAGLVRERFRLRLKVQTLTAESRLQATVLLALPPVVFLVLWVLKRAYVAQLLDHPWVLVGTFASEVIGVVLIRRMTRVED